MDNWVGAMTAARLLQLYPDLKEHFIGEARNKVVMVPGYSEHALADLVLRFPYQAKNIVSSALNRFKLYLHINCKALAASTRLQELHLDFERRFPEFLV